MTDGSDTAVPKLVDFGLCKMVGPTEHANETLGTVAYAAPEVLRGV